MAALLVIYIILAFFWSLYCVIRTLSEGGTVFNLILAFVVNLIFFPLSVLYAMAYDRI
jgi:hypothetical protein